MYYFRYRETVLIDWGLHYVLIFSKWSMECTCHWEKTNEKNKKTRIYWKWTGKGLRTKQKRKKNQKHFYLFLFVVDDKGIFRLLCFIFKFSKKMSKIWPVNHFKLKFHSRLNSTITCKGAGMFSVKTEPEKWKDKTQSMRLCLTDPTSVIKSELTC